MEDDYTLLLGDHSKPLLNHQTVRGPVIGIGDAAVTEQRPSAYVSSILVVGYVSIPKNSHSLLI